MALDWAASSPVQDGSPIDDLVGVHGHRWTRWVPIILRGN